MENCKTLFLVKQCFHLTLYHIIISCTVKAFENIVTEGENAGHQHFLPFPTMFSTISKTLSNYFSHYNSNL